MGTGWRTACKLSKSSRMVEIHMSTEARFYFSMTYGLVCGCVSANWYLLLLTNRINFLKGVSLSINVEQNPIVCEQNLCWSVTKKHGITFMGECSQPVLLHGTQLSQLQAQDLNCTSATTTGK